MGIITSIGDSLQENRVALVAGKSGIGELELVDSKYAATLPFGEIKREDWQFKHQFEITDKRINRTTLLALHAIREALEMSSLSDQQISSEETALISGNTVGGMRFTHELYTDSSPNFDHDPFLYHYDNGTVSTALKEILNIHGPINTINTACSSSANSIAYGARLIQHGFTKRAIVGGADCLAKFTINGFNALHILSDARCQPFDRDRKGLNLGEGAAFLILEKEEDCKGKEVIAELTGWANTNDAFHPSSLSENGEGPYRAMTEALQKAQLSADKISFINAHGTGTENNDEVESVAIKRIFETIPPFVSSKSNVGHTLGGSGAVEAVYSILSLVNQELYPGLNFENPIESTGLVPHLKYTKAPLNHVMSNSFGFGGNCSSLIFSKV